MSDEPHYKCLPWCDAVTWRDKEDLEACNCGAMTNLAAWRQGVIAGMRRFAWWKDGVEYVGSCGTTLKKAVEDVNKLHPLPSFPEQVWEK